MKSAPAPRIRWEGESPSSPRRRASGRDPRGAAVLVDLGGDGIDVLRGKFPDVFADEFLFLRQPEIHAVPSLFGHGEFFVITA